MPHFYLFIYFEKQWCRIPKRLKKERVEDEDYMNLHLTLLNICWVPALMLWTLTCGGDSLQTVRCWKEWLMAFLSNRVGLFVYYFILFFFCSVTHDADRNKNSFCASVLLYIPKVEYVHRFTPIEVDWKFEITSAFLSITIF